MNHFFNIELLGNLGYFLALAAFLFSNIIYLRAVTVLAGVVSTFYFYYRGNAPIWTAVFWQFMFIGINLIQIILLILRKSTFSLTEYEKLIYRLGFSHIQPGQFKQLMKNAKFKALEAGEALIRENSEVKELSFIIEGEVEIKHGEKVIAQCNQGDFLGEMAFISGKKAAADVFAKTQLYLVSWNFNALNKFLDKNIELKTLIYSTLGLNLVKKLTE